MYETLKEVIEAASNRVRSPILGMIALVYFYLNWKPLFLLMLSDEPAEKRLQLFDQYSDWKNGVLFPIIFGFILSIAYPWLVLAGAWLVSNPIGRYRDFVDLEKQTRKISSLRNEIKLSKIRSEVLAIKSQAEEIIEQSIIDRAKRLSQLKDIADETIRVKAELEINQARQLEPNGSKAVSSYFKGDLSEDSAINVLLPAIAANPAGSVSLHDLGSTFTVSIGTEQFDLDSRRDYNRILEAMRVLENRRLILNNGTNTWLVSSEGYERAEKLD